MSEMFHVPLGWLKKHCHGNFKTVIRQTDGDTTIDLRRQPLMSARKKRLTSELLKRLVTSQTLMQE